MRLLSYVVAVDSGFAPNPFWDFCTLAACTPNHMGVYPDEGDWVLGSSSLETDQRLIYAMCISEVLCFDDYYRAKRFAQKKARPGTWQERCGDNIYFLNKANNWVQGRAFHHTSGEQIKQDTRYPRVFISEHFFYFGEKAPAIPQKFASLIQGRQGCTWHEGKTAEAFIKWLEGKYKPGRRGLPRDRDDATLACEPDEQGNEVC